MDAKECETVAVSAEDGALNDVVEKVPEQIETEKENEGETTVKNEEKEEESETVEAKDSPDGANNNNTLETLESPQAKNYKNVILEDWECEGPREEAKNGGADKKEEKPTETVADTGSEDANGFEPETLEKKPNDLEKELIKPVLDKKKNPLKYSNLIVSNQDIVEILDNSVERVCRPIIPAKDIFLSIELTKHLNQKLSPTSAGKKNGTGSDGKSESPKKVIPLTDGKVNDVAADKTVTPEKTTEERNATEQNKKGKKKTSKKSISLGDEMERTIALRQLRDEFPTTRRRSHTTKKINHIPFLASTVLEKALTTTVTSPKSGRRRPCYLPDDATPEKGGKSGAEASEAAEEKTDKSQKLSDLSNTSTPVVRTYCIKRKSTEAESEVKSALQTFLSATKEFQEGDEENIESKPKKQKTAQQEGQKSGKVQQQQQKKGKSEGGGSKKRNLELEKLLGDEGAVRMLYETQHKDDGSRFTGKKSRKTTSGLKKDLMLKTKLVKNAVLRLSGASSDGVSLRGKRRSVKSEADATPDPDALFATSTPNVILYKPKKKQRAEASRILYRHSSSESFDSDDEDNGDGEKRKSLQTIAANGDNSTAETNLANGDLFKDKSASEEEEEEEGKKTVKRTKKVKKGSRESVDSQGKLVWSNVPVRKSCRPRVVSKKYSIWASTSMDSLSVESLGLKKPKKASQELTKKLNYKELRILQHGNLVQIVLSSSSTVLKNSFNEQVLTELTEALDFLSQQESCSVVLLTATGTTFCQGIDLNYVLSVEEEDRKTTFGNLLSCLERLILCLANYKKPIIAGVHAGAVGLGVTLLAYCDIVISSDRAFFYTPYARLGQMSEGAATVTFPRISKNLVTELLYKSEKISALEAMKLGLVSQVIPEERFEEELLLTSRRIASHSVQAMQSMKSLMNKNDFERIVDAVDAESQLILEHWCSNECVNNIIKFLNSGEVQFRPLDVT